MDFESPFLTFTNTPLDRNYLGEVEELAALHRRTDALDYALRHGKEFDVVLDMLEEDGQDASDYVDLVGQQLELIKVQNIVPADLQSWRSLLPR